MHSTIHRYYDRYSMTGLWYFFYKSLFNETKLRKMSMLNRFKDYQRLSRNAELLRLHREMNDLLQKASDAWHSYDYGEGYFYQSFQRIGVTGLRDTEARIEVMDLGGRIKDKTVLEIGCNSGFIALSIGDMARSVVAFDINPYLIEIARSVAGYLGVENIDLLTTSFEGYETEKRFDVILSFANHSTYDGNTAQSVRQYFRRCEELLTQNGLLLFESHHPQLEGEGLEEVCAIIEDLFVLRERRVLEYGSFLDQGRTFVVASKK